MSTENADINKDQEEVVQEVNTVENDNGNQEVEMPELVIEEELAKEKDRFLRLFAEFENYKKRTSKERMELFKTASEEVLVALLPVLDDFDRALTEMAKMESQENLLGISLISNKFRDVLSSKGLTEVAVAKGDAFSVDHAEAITQIPAGDKMKGKIVDVIEKGYQLGDKIIRFPKVVIGQ
ncbi:nucleotide exchange factor GrpE [Flavobacterium sp. JP2137]|uniref:nucleotide exchange factor GrpE n=1 Tax=Flavobacterium sp. JP2137 TaxID=3414510 RepID=UPI003D2FB794